LANAETSVAKSRNCVIATSSWLLQGTRLKGVFFAPFAGRRSEWVA